MTELVHKGVAGKLIIGWVWVLQPHLFFIGNKNPVGAWRLMTYIHDIKILGLLRRGSSEDGFGYWYSVQKWWPFSLIPLNLTLLVLESQSALCWKILRTWPQISVNTTWPKMSSIYSPTGSVSTTLREGISGYIDRSKLESRLYQLFGCNIQVVVSKHCAP